MFNNFLNTPKGCMLVLGQLPLQIIADGQLPPGQLAPQNNFPQDNCSRLIASDNSFKQNTSYVFHKSYNRQKVSSLGVNYSLKF